VVSKGQATSTADHLFLRPGENRLDKHPQNPWETINGCETGMPLMTLWPKDGYYTANKRDPLITVHGILDPWCQQYNYYDHLIACILLWCLFNSHGPKTLWLLLTPFIPRLSSVSVSIRNGDGEIVASCSQLTLPQKTPLTSDWPWDNGHINHTSSSPG
jgi:hypothetical protein